MMDEHDLNIFKCELRKLKEEYDSTSNDILREQIQQDILFLEEVLNDGLVSQ